MVTNGAWIKGLGAAAATAGLLVSLGLGALAQDAGKKPSAATATTSACKGLTESACKLGTTCAWIAPKTGKQKPYCRVKSTKSKK